MKYVYPNNLMARRSERKEAIKGGILLGLFCLLIVGLFLASEFSQNVTFTKANLVCNSHGECRLG